MKQIVRIEHKDSGIGIWNHYRKESPFKRSVEVINSYELLRDRHLNFPRPFEETNLKGIFNRDYYCAFKSLDQLKEWIYDNEVKELIDQGFIILLIELNDYHEGDYQIIFKKEDIITRKDITDIFK